jgi:hypothetical protein
MTEGAALSLRPFSMCRCEPFASCHSDPERSEGEESQDAQDRLRVAIPGKQNSKVKGQNDRAKMKKKSV